MRTRLLNLLTLMPRLVGYQPVHPIRVEGPPLCREIAVVSASDLRDLILTTPFIVDPPATDKMSVGGM
jgi:hypothetical protein